MVINWDKSKNDPDLRSSAGETIQAAVREAETLPEGTQADAVSGDPAGPGSCAEVADRPLGRRVAAGLVDLGVLAGLYVIMSLIVGPTSPRFGPVSLNLFVLTFTTSGGGVFSVGLFGAWAVLYLILLPGYYFVLETAAGQTAGKALLGLRVLRSGGARPTAGPIALRTLLRLCDGLPAFYLAGFIVMLCTGRRRRQRLGDLAGDTIVVRTARTSRSVALAVTCLAVVALATAGLSASRLASSAGSQAFRGHGISFRYPGGWGEGRSTIAEDRTNRLWSLAVGPGTGADVVIIDSYRLTKVVGAGNLPSAAANLRHLIGGSLRQDGGAILRGPQRITLGGMPGVRFQVGTYLPDGTPIQSILNYAFNGTTEYVINCQTTRAGAAAIAAGCGQVVSTFRTTLPPAANGATPPPTRTTLPPPPLSAAQWRLGLRLLQAQMNRMLEVTGVVTRDMLRAQVSQLQRCAPRLARLGTPASQLRPADRLATRACAQFARAARCYAVAARAIRPFKESARFDKMLHCGDTAATQGGWLIEEAVTVSAPS